MPAHVLVETYSVLTRLPAPHRVGPEAAARAVTALPFPAVSLPDAEYLDLLGRLAGDRITGGAVYDAVVGATAAHHGMRLLTRDRRARTTYDALGVPYSLL